jgi:Arc/MetJ family transcription regulator
MRTNIEIDDELIATAMRTYGLKTKREAVDFALRQLVAEPLGVDEARSMRGSGWSGDLDSMRSSSRPAGE